MDAIGMQMRIANEFLDLRAGVLRWRFQGFGTLAGLVVVMVIGKCLGVM